MQLKLWKGTLLSFRRELVAEDDVVEVVRPEGVVLLSVVLLCFRLQLEDCVVEALARHREPGRRFGAFGRLRGGRWVAAKCYSKCLMFATLK